MPRSRLKRFFSVRDDGLTCLRCLTYSRSKRDENIQMDLQQNAYFKVNQKSFTYLLAYFTEVSLLVGTQKSFWR